jgi:hypothetical protein
VNTSGWVKGNHTFYIFTAHKLLKIYILSWYSFNGFCLAFSGVGYEVLVDTLKYICPTYIVKICISGEGYENKNLPAGKFWLDGEDDGTIKLIEIDSALRDSSNINRP